MVWVMKSTTLPWTSGYFQRSRSSRCLLRFPISLRSLAVIRVMIVLPHPLLPALPCTLLLPLLLRFPALFFFGDCGVRDNADPWRQSLLLAFFLAAPDVDIHVVGISPLLFVGAPQLPEAAFVEAFAVGQLFAEVSVHAGANLFDLSHGALHRSLIGKWKLLHASQQRDNMIHALVQQEEAFVDAQLRGTCGQLRGKGGADTFVASHRCTSYVRFGQGRVRCSSTHASRLNHFFVFFAFLPVL